jgi:hypothetical protein
MNGFLFNFGIEKERRKNIQFISIQPVMFYHLKFIHN